MYCSTHTHLLRSAACWCAFCNPKRPFACATCCQAKGSTWPHSDGSLWLRVPSQVQEDTCPACDCFGGQPPCAAHAVIGSYGAEECLGALGLSQAHTYLHTTMSWLLVVLCRSEQDVVSIVSDALNTCPKGGLSIRASRQLWHSNALFLCADPKATCESIQLDMGQMNKVGLFGGLVLAGADGSSIHRPSAFDHLVDPISFVDGKGKLRKVHGSEAREFIDGAQIANLDATQYMAFL